MSQEQELLPVKEEQKLLDRPAEERLRDELDHQKQTDGVRPSSGDGHRPPEGDDHKDDKRKDDQQKAEERPKASRKGLIIAVLIALLVLAGIFLAGYLPRRNREKTTEKSASREAQAIPSVDVVKVRRSPSISRLLLPGNITPLIEAPIFARASGYITKRYVDIGDHVHKNQLMATIEAPDLDQQVAQGRSQLSQARQQLGQAEAALQQAEAQLELAKVTWDRYAVLVQDGAVAKQDADTQKANYDTNGATVNSNKANVRAAEDNVKAAQANLDRLIALQGFKEVRAPFDGIVTARNIDVGSYISTQGSQSGTTVYGQSQSLGSTAAQQSGEIFDVAQISRLRILINVPQTDAANVHVGQQADVLVQQFRTRRFAGNVTRTANSLDPTTRTLLTEVQVDNSKHDLLPGMYALVQFSSPRSNPPLLVPGDALVSRADGVLIAVLKDPDEKTLQKRNSAQDGADQHHEKPKQIHMQKVEVGRDYGTDTEVTVGLQGWEYVVTNPSDDVYEGALVLPSSAKGAQGSTPAGGPTDKRPTGGAETSAGTPPPASSKSGGSSGGDATGNSASGQPQK